MTIRVTKYEIDAAVMMGCKNLSELAAMGEKVRELARRLEVAKKISKESGYGRNRCNRVDFGAANPSGICGAKVIRKSGEV